MQITVILFSSFLSTHLFQFSILRRVKRLDSLLILLICYHCNAFVGCDVKLGQYFFFFQKLWRIFSPEWCDKLLPMPYFQNFYLPILKNVSSLNLRSWSETKFGGEFRNIILFTLFIFLCSIRLSLYVMWSLKSYLKLANKVLRKRQKMIL